MKILHYESKSRVEAEALAAMYEARKRVFVDLLRWDLPVRDGRFEIDQFDGPATRYIILVDKHGAHRGSMRLLPTEGPHILGSIFPILCDDGVPAAPHIWEISRFCLSRDLRAAERRIVRDQLVTACVLFAIDHGIEAYSCVAGMSWMSQILAFGWRCAPLGLPVALDSGMTGALLIHIDPDTPARMRDAGCWAPPARGDADRIAA